MDIDKMQKACYIQDMQNEPRNRNNKRPFKPVLVSLPLETLAQTDQAIVDINKERREHKQKELNRGEFVNHALQFFLESDIPIPHLHIEPES